MPRLAAIEQLCGVLSAGWDAAQIQVRRACAWRWLLLAPCCCWFPPAELPALHLQAELGRDVARVLVAADAASDTALGYIVGWLIAGELQARCRCSRGQGNLAAAACLSLQWWPASSHAGCLAHAAAARCLHHARTQVLELAVDPSHQGRGAGSALLRALLDGAR